MVQRAIAVFLAVGLHSGDATVPAVAYEVRSWNSPPPDGDCSGPPDYVWRYPLDICREDEYAGSLVYCFDRQINDTHLGMKRPAQGGPHPPYYEQCCEGHANCQPEYFELMGICYCDSDYGQYSCSGYFWVYSKDLAV